MLAFLPALWSFATSKTGAIVLAVLGSVALIAVAIVHFENEGAAEATATLTIDQAQQTLKEQSADTAAAALQQQKTIDAIKQVDRADAANAAKAAAALQAEKGSPDANAPVSDDMQRLLDSLRDQPATAADSH